MKKVCCLIVSAICFMPIFGGCESSSSSSSGGLHPSGFLSDYSKLKQMSDTSYRYVNPNVKLSSYRSFIVDPVKPLFKYGKDTDVKTWDDVAQLRAYMQSIIEKTIWNEYTIVDKPGPDVARARAAITEVKRATAFSKASVTVEIEIVDSQTGGQIAALVETQEKGGPLGEYYDWENAKKIMDEWGDRFRDRLREIQEI
jgi:hypothetical protein